MKIYWMQELHESSEHFRFTLAHLDTHNSSKSAFKIHYIKNKDYIVVIVSFFWNREKLFISKLWVIIPDD